MKNNKLNGFTLVELIVVIVILAVLAAISFMMVTKWINKSSNARAASDVGTITRALHGHYSEKGTYPETSKPIGMLSATGLLLGEQGVFDEEVIKSLGTFSKLPKDPKANDYYMYTVIKNPSKGFEVGAVFENPEISVLGTKVYADGAVNAIPYVQSNYHGKYYAADGVTPIFPKPLSVFDQSSGKYLQESIIGENGELVIDLALLTGKQLTSFSADGVMIGGEYGDYIMPKVGYTASGALGSFSTGVIMQALPQSVTSVTTSSLSSSSSSSSVPSPVNGVCGSNNGLILTSKPTVNLCITGDASTVNYLTGMGTYSWTCSGINGGSTSNCLAKDNYTKLLLHFDGNAANSGSNLGIITNVGGIIYTVPGKFGNAATLSGNNYLKIPDSNDWDFESQDFTVDFWIKKTGARSTTAGAVNTFIGHGTQLLGNGGYQFGASNVAAGVYVSINGTSWLNASVPAFTWTNSQWYHVAYVRNGSTITTYIDGQAKSPTINISTSTIFNSTNELVIGARNPYDQFIIGHMDELRISKGIARRTGNFTPPTQAY